ncbi:hypothetical protein [Streptomyces sp. NRRL S-118]|nr:hypothetical protein [Streptomyces sp. NRRL S-118]
MPPRAFAARIGYRRPAEYRSRLQWLVDDGAVPSVRRVEPVVATA